MDAIKELKNLYNSGTLILNKNILERLKVYFHTDKVLVAAGIDVD